MYFGPITGARAYKWVGSLYVGVFPPHPFFKGKALGTRLGRGLYVGWSLYVGGEAYTCVCVAGGGGYKKRFTVPGLKTTNDVTQKHKGVKITKLGKTIATKLSKTSPIFTPRMTPLFSITYLWLFRSFFQFFF